MGISEPSDTHWLYLKAGIPSISCLVLKGPKRSGARPGSICSALFVPCGFGIDKRSCQPEAESISASICTVRGRTSHTSHILHPASPHFLKVLLQNSVVILPSWRAPSPFSPVVYSDAKTVVFKLNPPKCWPPGIQETKQHPRLKEACWVQPESVDSACGCGNLVSIVFVF